MFDSIFSPSIMIELLTLKSQCISTNIDAFDFATRLFAKVAEEMASHTFAIPYLVIGHWAV